MDARPHAPLSFEEFLAWLDEYWALFGPPAGPNVPYVTTKAVL